MITPTDNPIITAAILLILGAIAVVVLYALVSLLHDAIKALWRTISGG